MTIEWVTLFNLEEFEALDLVSREFKVFFTDLGEMDVLVTKGNSVNILFNSYFLQLNLNEKNPFEFQNHFVYLDEDGEVQLGRPVAD